MGHNERNFRSDGNTGAPIYLIPGNIERILTDMNLYKNFFKRAIDMIASGCGLIVLSPIIGGTALWLHFANKGAGAFFTQERPGKNGKLFKVVKFKTMTDECGPDGELLEDKYRLTKVGKFVRAASLDELPQLWNVFKGDMALIGPRPLLVKYLSRYTPEQARRHEVRPGITGWAQVNGRNNISWEKKFELDVYYVDNISFKLDCKVLLSTLKKVLFREDVSKEGRATTTEFFGIEENEGKKDC